jgi:hypothetical protein
MQASFDALIAQDFIAKDDCHRQLVGRRRG